MEMRNNSDNVLETSLTKSINKLETFIDLYVEYFERKLNEFKKEASVGGTQKTGKKTEDISKPIGTGIGAICSVTIGTIVFGSPGSSVVAGSRIGGKFGKYIGDKLNDHRKKAKRVTEIFRNIKKDDLRKIIVTSGGDIYRCFEYQFLLVTDINGCSLSRALEKLAVDAVDRTFEYIDDYENKCYTTAETITIRDLITQGVIFGQSKVNSILKVFSPGHTVKNASVEWHTAEIFERVGIVTYENNDCVTFYKKGFKSDTQKYGYRLLFNWESLDFKKYIKSTETIEFNFVYSFINEFELHEKLTNLLETINDNDISCNIKSIKNDMGKLLNLNLKQTDNCTIKEPVWFDIRYQVVTFTGREKLLKSLHDALNSDRGNVCLTGLGGIGKSELARNYANNHSKDYDGNVIWINADTSVSLKSSFQRLAKKLNISINETLDIDDEEQVKEIKTIAKDIYRYLKYTKSLFIFDNADELNNIKEILPLTLPPQYIKPHILITSRNQNWDIGDEGNMIVLKVNKFSQKEAQSFIKKALKIKFDDKSTDILKLANLLYYFPLALRQATSYIQEKNLEMKTRGYGHFDICDYINEFEKESKITELLDYKSKHGNDRYFETVLTTWKITLTKIEKCGNKKLLEIIQVMAYLTSEGIPIKKLFLSLFDDEEMLWNAVDLLRQYSMITVENGKSIIHRLVQQVIRLEIKEKGMEIEVLKKVFSILNHETNFMDAQEDNYIYFWIYASKYPELIREYYNEKIYFISNPTPLHLLAKCGYAEGVKNILNYMKENHENKFNDILYAKDKIFRTPLFLASENGHLDVIKILTENVDDVKIKYSIISAYSGHVNVVEYLQPKKKSFLLHSKLHCSIRNGNFYEFKQILYDIECLHARKIKTKIIKYGFNESDFTEYYNYIDIMKILNNHITDDEFRPCSLFNKRLRTKRTKLLKIFSTKKYKNILIAASKDGQLDIVKELINEKNYDVNVFDDETTPLHAAVFFGQINIVEYLLGDEIKEKAKINIIDNLGITPFIYALANYNNVIESKFLNEKNE